MDSKYRSIFGNSKKGLKIEVAGNKCQINGVVVRFESTLLIRKKNKIFVDIASIVRLLGGGVEVIPDTGSINICVCNKRIVLKGVLKDLYDGYFNQNILSNIWKIEPINDFEVRITI